MTNQELLQKMDEEMILRGLSPATMKYYRVRTHTLMNHYNPKPLADVTESEFREFLLYQRAQGNMAPGTINTYNSVMRFIIGSVVGRLVNYQMIPRVKITRRLPDIMTDDEIVALFEACNDGTKWGLRDKAILMTMYASGLRLSEVVNLKCGDIIASSGSIKVRFGKGQKDRLTLLSKVHLQILTDYWRAMKPNTPDRHLFITKFGSPITPRAVQDIFSKRLNLAGLSHKPYTPHTLRHNFATAMLNSGTDVCTIKKLLGHTHIQSTTFYLHLLDFDDTLVSPLDRLNEKNGGNKNA